jgi:hypothetical protein
MTGVNVCTMRDIPMILGIIIFWFVMSIILTDMANDPTIVQTSFEGNSTTVIDIDTSSINMTAIPTGDDVTPVSFMNLLARIFTFRLNTIVDMPVLISSIISFINYLLVLWFGILLFRQFSIGGGSG